MEVNAARDKSGIAEVPAVMSRGQQVDAVDVAGEGERDRPPWDLMKRASSPLR